MVGGGDAHVLGRRGPGKGAGSWQASHTRAEPAGTRQGQLVTQTEFLFTPSLQAMLDGSCPSRIPEVRSWEATKNALGSGRWYL